MSYQIQVKLVQPDELGFLQNRLVRRPISKEWRGIAENEAFSLLLLKRLIQKPIFRHVGYPHFVHCDFFFRAKITPKLERT